MDSDPAKRNVAGLLEEHPDALRDGIALRKFGQQVIERLAKERVHPSWTVPGGVNAPLDPPLREKTLAEIPAAVAILRRTLDLWKKTVDSFPQEIESFSNFPTMYAGLVGPDGSLRLYDGKLRFVGPEGRVVADQVAPRGLRLLHRRGDALRLLPQGALLQAVGLPRGHLPRRARSPASTPPSAAAPRSPTRSSRSTASASAASSRAASTTTTRA